MNILCDRCAMPFKPGQIDCKPAMTPRLWLAKLFKGQREMLAYAADHGYDFNRCYCRHCYGKGFQELQEM